jgi:hypothetical protein
MIGVASGVKRSSSDTVIWLHKKKQNKIDTSDENRSRDRTTEGDGA